METTRQDSESQAIARLKRGDIQGLAHLVERYQIKALRTAYLITTDRALAEDIVQTAFVRVYERIQQFDDQRPFAPWFMRMVANDALYAITRQQHPLSLNHTVDETDLTWVDLLPETDPAALPDLALEAVETREVVWGALQQLSPDQRTVIVLRYYLGLSEEELADQLNSPPGTVKWRLHAARKHLRGLLARFHIATSTIVESREA